jgi:hypothetical protein
LRTAACNTSVQWEFVEAIQRSLLISSKHIT